MKSITTQKILELATLQDPEPELYKMSYTQILATKNKIEKIVSQGVDDELFSTLMRLKSHVMVCEDWIRYTEVRQIEALCSLEEIVSYIDESEKKEMALYV